jgi:hypothetical protein
MPVITTRRGLWKLLSIARLAGVAKDNTALPRTKKPDVSARLLFRKNNREDLHDKRLEYRRQAECLEDHIAA